VHVTTLSDPAKILEIEHPPNVTAMAFSPDGTRLAVGASDFAIRIFDLGTGDELMVLRDHSLPIEAIRFSKDGTSLATVSSSEVRVWRAPPQ
jgi:WD40 repeat protein